MANQQKLIEELFLRGCAPVLMEIIEKHGKEFCDGCRNDNPGRHAHSCQEEIYREKIYKMKNKALMYLAGKHREILQMMFAVYQTLPKFWSLHAGELLFFFSNSMDPIVQLYYEQKWYHILEDIMVKLQDNM